MRAASLIFSALLAVASAHPLSTAVKRDAASIVSAIQNVQFNLATVNATLNGFNVGDLDGPLKLLAIQKQTNEVGDSVGAATAAAQQSEVLSQDDTQTVAASVLGLKADLDTFLANLERKKPAFDGVLLLLGVSETVESLLQTQKQQSVYLGDSIAAKLTGPLAGFAPLINQQIADRFDQAIAVFQQPRGVVNLPPLPSLGLLG